MFRNQPQGIGRGEVAESRIEAPFFAVFMVVCAMSVLVVHAWFGNSALTLALALSMIVLGVTVVKFELGVAILVVAMLLSPEIDFGTEISGEHELNVRYNDLLICVIFLGVLVKLAFEGRQSFWHPSPINVGIVLYYFICIVSTLLALRADLPAWDKRLALFVLLKMAEFYMIFFLVGNAIRSLRDIRQQLALFFVVATFISCYCLFMVRSVQRVGTPFEAQGSEPNTLGGYLMLVMCLSMGLLTQAKTFRMQFTLFSVTALAFVPFLYTLSRASYIALLVAMLALGALARRIYIILALALILILSPFLMPEGVKDRVNYTFQRGTGAPVKIAGRELGFQVDKSTHERFYVWQKVRFLLSVAPWFGGGVAWETVLDSQYARVIMETGLIGLAAFLFLQYRILKTCRESYLWSRDWVGRGLGLGITAATIGLITHSLGTISFLIVRIMEPFWFLVALAVIARSIAIQESLARRQQERQAALRPRPASAHNPMEGVPARVPEAGALTALRPGGTS